MRQGALDIGSVALSSERKTKMKNELFAMVFSLSGILAFAAPTVTSVQVAEDLSNNRVSVSYQFANGPAIITFDVVDTASGKPIDECNLWRVSGEVNRIVSGDGTNHSFVWRPVTDVSNWRIAAGNFRIRVKAWSKSAPPDYMVVNLDGVKSDPDHLTFYASSNAVPGGVLGDESYRTSKILMRKIHRPKGGKYWMGTAAADGDIEKSYGGASADEYPQHQVNLDYDFYIGVFELTQMQWWRIDRAKDDGTDAPRPTSYFTNVNWWKMRPMERQTYKEFRGWDNSSKETALTTSWPSNPPATCVCGKLRDMSGLAFDLPSDAEWEYAARAGHGSGEYGDGSAIPSGGTRRNDALARQARYLGNGVYEGLDWSTAPDWSVPKQFDANWGPESGTAVCGSYAPNSWGLYDVLGNVREYCLDWYDHRGTSGGSITSLNGQVNIREDDPRYCITDTDPSHSGPAYRVTRGGGWNDIAYGMRPGNRTTAYTQNDFYSSANTLMRACIGFRLRCPAIIP